MPRRPVYVTYAIQAIDQLALSRSSVPARQATEIKKKMPVVGARSFYVGACFREEAKAEAADISIRDADSALIERLWDLGYCP